MHTCNITVIINRFLNLDSAPGNRASPIARRKTAGTRDTLNSDPAPGNRMFLTARRKTAGSKSPSPYSLLALTVGSGERDFHLAALP